MNIVSTYVKRPMRWTFVQGKTREESYWAKEKVRLQPHQEMVMAIVEENGRKVTKHMVINKG